MRNVITLGIAAAVLVSTAVALAGISTGMWTEPKAERIVARDATVRLQGADRVLEAELQTSARLYSGLSLAALELGDPSASGVFQSLSYRFSTALDAVRNGVRIGVADCKGSGKANQGRRFQRFRCSAKSRLLKIPAVELVESKDGKLPTPIEGPARVLGPWRAQLDVRVKGTSAMSYRQVGIASRVFPAS